MEIMTQTNSSFALSLDLRGGRDILNLSLAGLTFMLRLKVEALDWVVE